MIQSYYMADTAFTIDSLYPLVHQQCRAYRSEEPGKLYIQTTEADIAYERARAAQTDLQEGNPKRSYSDAYLETLAVYRHLCEALIEQRILLMHGSVVAVDGRGYLFTAKSGTGKSTHTRFWREQFGSRAVMVNDDKPLLRIEKTGVTVYGTPWDGKHHLSSNISVPLQALCLLHRSAENHIEPISFRAAYAALLQQVYRPQDVQKMQETFSLLDQLGECVPIYQLGCNLQPAAAEIAYQGMKPCLHEAI